MAVLEQLEIPETLVTLVMWQEENPENLANPVKEVHLALLATR